MRAVLGLGANLGDRLATLREAVRRLGAVATVEGRSRVYENEALGPPQPGYLNAAVLVRFAGDARGLLDAALGVEAALGRVRRERWGPRTIDIDILWIDGVSVDDAGLVVPHPHLRERAFAIVPLLELVPEARDPRSGEAYAVPGGQPLVKIADSL